MIALRKLEMAMRQGKLEVSGWQKIAHGKKSHRRIRVGEILQR